MIRCVIIDDEPLAIEIIQTYLERLSGFELSASFTSPVEALAYVHQHQTDLIFLDIEMPLFNGLEFARTLNYKPAIIITTAYREYAVEGFELNVVDYLLKPIAFQRFIAAASKVSALKNKMSSAIVQTQQADPAKNDEDIWLKVDKKLIRITIDDILYIESLKDYIRVKTKGGELVTYLSLNGILEKLPESKFVRIHKSFIAAVQKIDLIDGNRIIVAGKALPLGRNFRENLIQKIQNGFSY